MCRKLMLYTSTKNNIDIFQLKEIAKSLNTSLIVCDNVYSFHKNYNFNIGAILFYTEDYHILKKVINEYPKGTHFNLINISEFNSEHIDLSNSIQLTNKVLMTNFLDNLYIYSTTVSAILIKKIIINAVNFNFVKVTSSLIYYTCKQFNMNAEQEIPLIREYLKNWYKLHYKKILNYYPEFSTIKKIRVNSFLNIALHIYKRTINNINNNYKKVFPYFEHYFYLEKLYGKNFNFIKTTKTFEVLCEGKDKFKNIF